MECLRAMEAVSFEARLRRVVFQVSKQIDFKKDFQELNDADGKCKSWTFQIVLKPIAKMPFARPLLPKSSKAKPPRKTKPKGKAKAAAKAKASATPKSDKPQPGDGGENPKPKRKRGAQKWAFLLG